MPTKTQTESKPLRTRYTRLQELSEAYRGDPAFQHLRYKTHFVSGAGSAFPAVVFVRDIPDPEEAAQGRAGCGRGGSVLMQLLASIDLKPEHVYITHALKYRTPGGRDPRDSEQAPALRYLHREIGILKPKVVVPMGRYVNGLYFPERSLAHLHGEKVIDDDYSYVPMFSPNVVLHNPALMKTLINDIQAVHELL